MNPGLTPPPEVAAAAKRGLELREKFRRAGLRLGFIAQSGSRNAGRFPCAISSR
jgi:hypothetical protein